MNIKTDKEIIASNEARRRIKLRAMKEEYVRETYDKKGKDGGKSDAQM